MVVYRDQLNLTVQLPSLNLRNQSGPSFMEQFRQYQACEEWSYFNEKKVAPMKDAYFQVRRGLNQILKCSSFNILLKYLKIVFLACQNIMTNVVWFCCPQ